MSDSQLNSSHLLALMTMVFLLYRGKLKRNEKECQIIFFLEEKISMENPFDIFIIDYEFSCAR